MLNSKLFNEFLTLKNKDVDNEEFEDIDDTR